MAQFIPLTPRAFGNKTWKRALDFRFAAHDQVVPLVAQELAGAAPEMPVGFVKNADQFLLVALLSYRPNDNFYVSPEGKWLVQYTPVALRAHPFRLVRQQATDKMVLCVDQEAVMNSPGEEIFFDEGDKPSKAVQQILQLLEMVERNRQATAFGVAALAEAGLIVPWEIKVRSDGQTFPVSGFHKVDEDALNRLPDEGFLKLRKVGAILLAYAQLFSMQQLHLLGKLAAVQSQFRTDPRLQIPSTQLNEMFKLDDGTLQF